MMRTTNIDKIENGAPFTWGHIITVYTVGMYQIAEYIPWATDGCASKVGVVNSSKRNFHTWVEGRDTARSYDTLDEALAGCIAYAAEGPNSQAAEYFMRMIKER